MNSPLHPVIEVLRARSEDGSVPGARRDQHLVAAVFEGGGMRGVVSAAMGAAIERLGLTACFDLVVGSSAGAMNGAALLGGAAAHGPALYCGPLASRRFINPARLLLGRPALDVRFVLAQAGLGFDTDRLESVMERALHLHCVALDVDTAQPVTFAGMRTRQELWDALLATTRMPWVGGGPMTIAGRRFIDGALVASIPLAAALEAGSTHVLVLQTRPFGVPRSTGSRIGDALIERHLRGLNHDLVQVWRDRIPAYERLVEDIARRTAAPGAAPPYVFGLRPVARTPVVRQLERRATVLAAAAAAAERLVEDTLGSSLVSAIGAEATSPTRRSWLVRHGHNAPSCF